MERVTQIIPAVGWRLAYFDTDTRQVFYNEIIAFGLTSEGDVVPIAWNETESDDSPMKAVNFVGLCPPESSMPVGHTDISAWLTSVEEKYGKKAS